ncbi:hypothetical protein SERLADRAFT_442673 [Serpula lacrymans var. lacrymans S7.9]|uniref:Uncharacterized protein n=1 Tax=Serpula lacrymans var. lacrymans (strain S7.9) TaxID=578457 RepID=F8PAK9_SERL9|nr:uncharacterized protein SERLADRAFT_442673 [Serpula lacrymans var. lacrymans S7.9]EGO19848.1 hypothetical protein SERLADRAFT_442673 [Serpula lacrymans var. lacrymans S7.9]
MPQLGLNVVNCYSMISSEILSVVTPPPSLLFTFNAPNYVHGPRQEDVVAFLGGPDHNPGVKNLSFTLDADDYGITRGLNPLSMIFTP